MKNLPIGIQSLAFKFNKTAQAALDQILKGDYAAKFRATGKPITAIGVNVDPALREISEWVEEGF